MRAIVTVKAHCYGEDRKQIKRFGTLPSEIKPSKLFSKDPALNLEGFKKKLKRQRFGISPSGVIMIYGKWAEQTH